MRVIVCGSRSWRDQRRISCRLGELPRDVTIVVGYDPQAEQPGGADRIAYHEALKLGLFIECFAARWDLHGRSAGFVRNARMVAEGADLCLAFWDGRSRGTLDTIHRARRAGIPAEVEVAV